MQKHKRDRKIGLPPGTLLKHEELQSVPVRQTIFTFDKKGYSKEKVSLQNDYSSIQSSENVSWLNIDGVHKPEILENIGKMLHIHPLVLEDIQNTEQRPKIEVYDDHIYCTFKMLSWDKNSSGVLSEQVSLILGSTYVISFQERIGDVFDPIRKRIINGTGRIRKGGADYLAYALLDAVVDNYFLVLEELENNFEDLENEILLLKKMDVIQQIHHMKIQLIEVRRNVWPLREMLHTIQKDEHVLISESTKLFFNDVYDHTLRAIDIIELLREMVAGSIDLHVTNLNNNLNQVMRVLTIIATIFIPLTFIAGVYGMNFQFMPELSRPWAYPAVLSVMACVAIGMILFFKRRKWL